jgi:hypothetical protein
MMRTEQAASEIKSRAEDCQRHADALALEAERLAEATVPEERISILKRLREAADNMHDEVDGIQSEIEVFFLRPA